MELIFVLMPFDLSVLAGRTICLTSATIAREGSLDNVCFLVGLSAALLLDRPFLEWTVVNRDANKYFLLYSFL